MWQNICISTPDCSTFYYDPFRDAASSIPAVFINLDEALDLRRSNATFLSVDNAAIGVDNDEFFCNFSSTTLCLNTVLSDHSLTPIA